MAAETGPPEAVQLETRVNEAVARHQAGLEDLWRLVGLVKRSGDLTSEERERLLATLFQPLSTKDIRQDFVTDGNAHGIGVSFRSSINKLMRVKHRMQHHGYRIAPGGNSKIKDRSFARALGIPVPETITYGIRIADIDVRPNTIIKPVKGSASKGVFFVDGDRQLHSMKTTKVYPTLAHANAEIERYRESISTGSWMVEQAVVDESGRPAPDLKLYMFYGRPGLALDIRRAQGPNGADLYAAYDHAGMHIEIGPRYRHIRGTGLPDDVLQKARRISLESPVPFLRVDFHRGRDESVLGEITPHPGGVYAGELYDALDRDLGERFVDAEARLFIDMLNGRSFDTYVAHYNAAPRPGARAAPAHRSRLPL